MGTLSTSEVRVGMKVEIDKEPYLIVSNEFVKPGKGQAFNRMKMKNMKSARVIERTYKSGEKIELADVEEMQMRFLYKDSDGAVFMDDKTFEQISIPFTLIGLHAQWLMEDTPFQIIFYNGEPIDIAAPTFMEMAITETTPGIRGDTASGRVLKPAVTETGAKVQVPIFIEEGEKIKIDTRTCEYVSRVNT